MFHCCFIVCAFEIGSVTTGDGIAAIGTQPTDMTVHKLYVYNSCQDPLPVLGETPVSKAAGYKQFTLPHLQQLRCQVNASVWDFSIPRHGVIGKTRSC